MDVDGSRGAAIRVGGAAGDGVQSIGVILARSLAREGFPVHAYNSYQSVIRGGHVWYDIRVGNDRTPVLDDSIDVLIAIDHLSAEVHVPLLRPGGVLIHDADKVDVSDLELGEGVVELSLPAAAIAEELGSKLMANTVALGAAAYVAGVDEEAVRRTVADRFGGKGDDIVATNFEALQRGRQEAASIEPLFDHPPRQEPMALMTGNEALALGALAAGLGYYAAYPMTPATGILHFLAQHGPERGVVVKQMEDEIGVINSTIGAAYGGARAMCGTSGGGLALMTEAVGYASMAELGIVIVNAMRAGPSTGLPTKTEQADLWQMFGAGQGDFPRVILAPHDAIDAYHAAVQAHELAERFQLPVFIAMDFYLGETSFAVSTDALPPVTDIDRGRLVDESAGEELVRYQVTEDGVSPRSVPGTPGMAWVAPSDEHDEHAGLISDVRAGLPESLPIRIAQVDKRARKLDGVRAALDPPRLHGDTGPVLVCWGSTAPALREARGRLAADGIATRQLDLRCMVPMHTDEVQQALEGQQVYFVELSASGQLEDLVRMKTGIVATGRVRRYDGEPLSATWLADRLRRLIQGPPDPALRTTSEVAP